MRYAKSFLVALAIAAGFALAPQVANASSAILFIDAEGEVAGGAVIFDAEGNVVGV